MVFSIFTGHITLIFTWWIQMMLPKWGIAGIGYDSDQLKIHIIRFLKLLFQVHNYFTMVNLWRHSFFKHMSDKPQKDYIYWKLLVKCASLQQKLLSEINHFVALSIFSKGMLLRSYRPLFLSVKMCLTSYFFHTKWKFAHFFVKFCWQKNPLLFF